VGDNRLLFAAPMYDSGANWMRAFLYELVGSSFVQLQTIGLAASGFTPSSVLESVFENAFALFEDGGDVFLIWFGSSDSIATFGSHAAKYVSTGGAGTPFTESAIMGVIPPTWLPTSYGGTSTGRHSWTVMKDTDSVFGTADVYLFADRYRTSTGVNGELFKWNGESSLLTSEGGVTLAGLWPPMIVEGGGDRIWTSGEMNITIVSTPTPVIGGEEFRFTAWGAPSGADKNVSFWFSKLGQSPNTQATLFGTPYVVSGPAPVPTLNVGLKRLEGVTADGVTIYAVNRNNVADGVSYGNREGIAPAISV